MRVIELLVSNRELCLSIVFSAIISFIIAVIAQSIYDSFIYYQDDDEVTESISVSDDELFIGCRVYDILTHCIGYYCGEALGEDNNIYAVVVVTDANTIYCYKTVTGALLTVDEQVEE